MVAPACLMYIQRLHCSVSYSGLWQRILLRIIKLTLLCWHRGYMYVCNAVQSALYKCSCQLPHTPDRCTVFASPLYPVHRTLLSKCPQQCAICSMYMPHNAYSTWLVLLVLKQRVSISGLVHVAICSVSYKVHAPFVYNWSTFCYDHKIISCLLYCCDAYVQRTLLKAFRNVDLLCYKVLAKGNSISAFLQSPSLW